MLATNKAPDSAALNLSEAEQYVRVRRVARRIVRVLVLLVPLLAAMQHEDVAEQPEVHPARRMRGPARCARRCAPLPQQELQRDRPGPTPAEKTIEAWP